MIASLTLTTEQLADQMAKIAYRQGLQDGIIFMTELLRMGGAQEEQIKTMQRIAHRTTEAAIERAKQGFLAGFAQGANPAN